MNIEKFENEGTYEFRLMPNASNPRNYCITKRVRSTERPNNAATELNFSYILMDNEIKATILHRRIMKIARELMRGTEILINDDNIVLTTTDDISDIKYYSFTEDRDIRLHSDNDDIDIDEDTELFNDINVLFDTPVNLYNIKMGYKIVMSMKKVHGYKHFYDIKIFNDVEPLYKDGDDKNAILNMYSGIEPLDEVSDNYISDMLEKYPSLTVI